MIYFRLLCVLSVLFFSTSRGATNSWFPGAVELMIKPAIPTNFVLVSASPETKRGNADILFGVIWAPEATAQQFKFGGDGKLNKAEEPLFHVGITPLVRQIAGTDKFTNEDTMPQLRSRGLKNVNFSKTKWGAYPVLSMTCENPLDGTKLYVAWLGLNLPEEWTVLINYRVPQGKGHPTKEEERIWKRFLKETTVQE